jgi:hypothetical protein
VLAALFKPGEWTLWNVLVDKTHAFHKDVVNSSEECHMKRLPSSRIRWARTALGLDDPRLLGLLGLFWLATAVHILLHLTRRVVDVPRNRLFDLATEGGYGEQFFQTLTGWCALLLVLIAVRTREWVWLAWASFVLYLLADDYLTLHERMGVWIAEHAPAGLVSDHTGEALWLLGVGLVMLVAVAIAYRFSSADTRRTMLIVAALFALLALFGVGVDIIHSLVDELPFSDALFIALEDGGEIAVMSLIVVHLVSLAFPERAFLPVETAQPK